MSDPTIFVCTAPGEVGLGFSKRRSAGVQVFRVVEVRDKSAAQDFEKQHGAGALSGRILTMVNGVRTEDLAHFATARAADVGSKLIGDARPAVLKFELPDAGAGPPAPTRTRPVRGGGKLGNHATAAVPAPRANPTSLPATDTACAREELDLAQPEPPRPMPVQEPEFECDNPMQRTEAVSSPVSLANDAPENSITDGTRLSLEAESDSDLSSKGDLSDDDLSDDGDEPFSKSTFTWKPSTFSQAPAARNSEIDLDQPFNFESFEASLPSAQPRRWQQQQRQATTGACVFSCTYVKPVENASGLGPGPDSVHP